MGHIEIEGLLDGETERIQAADCRQAGRLLTDVGEAVPGRHGEAVHFGDLLQGRAPLAGATHLTIESEDGWSASLPLDEVREGWLVFAEGNEALSAKAGGPFRLFLPEQSDACANVKHLARLTFSKGAGKDTRPPEEERAC